MLFCFTFFTHDHDFVVSFVKTNNLEFLWLLVKIYLVKVMLENKLNSLFCYDCCFLVVQVYGGIVLKHILLQSVCE